MEARGYILAGTEYYFDVYASKDAGITHKKNLTPWP